MSMVDIHKATSRVMAGSVTVFLIALMVGGSSIIVRFLLCYSDASGYRDSLSCNIIGVLGNLLRLYPLAVILFVAAVLIKFVYFLNEKYGVKITVLVVCILAVLFFMVAPGNVSYLFWRVITLNP